jgi:hypothetical protein
VTVAVPFIPWRTFFLSKRTIIKVVKLNKAALKAYRQRTFRLPPNLPLRGPADAVRFVKGRGFVFFWPIQGIDLPSLWAAVAGDRPVASDHDDPAHVTWRWKDGLLNQKRWYYAKLLRGKATMVGLADLPYFYALSERVDELDDFRLAYDEGRLSWEAKLVAEALLEHGAQHTIRIRQLAHMEGGTSKSRFERALSELQRGLWILPIGVAEAGSWHYAFIYELFDRWLAETGGLARRIDRPDARLHLAGRYLDSVGAAEPKQLSQLFGWHADVTFETLAGLQSGERAVELDDGRWATTKLLGSG